MSDIERGQRRRKRGGGGGGGGGCGGGGGSGGIRGDEERRDNDRKRGGSENIKERLQVGMERDEGRETRRKLRERFFFFHRQTNRAEKTGSLKCKNALNSFNSRPLKVLKMMSLRIYHQK